MTRTMFHRFLRGPSGLKGVLGTLVLASVLGCSGASPTDGGTDGGTVKPPPEPAPYPAPRGFTQLVFHPPTGRVFLFGGESNQRTALADTWAYNVASNEWLEITGNPHPDAEGRAAAYDAESDRIIVHYTTRLDPNGPNGLNRISETWAFNPGAGTWTNMHPDPAPFGLMGARMVYDAAADRMILFGGADFTQDVGSWPYFNETWAYDFNTNTWSERHPDQSPPGRSYFGMVYDDVAERVLIYGGSFDPADADAAADLWAYDYASDHWEQIAYTGDAPSDHHPAMAYSPSLDRAFYMVGQSFYSFDYDSKAWTRLAYDPAMGDRHFQGMAFDDTSGKLVVFGGGPAGLQYDDQTWIYDPTSTRWQRALRP